MPYISYNYDPNDPKSEPKARNKAFLIHIFLIAFPFATIAGLVFYIQSLIKLFSGVFSIDLLYSIGLIMLFAIIFFFIITDSDKDARLFFAKFYFLYLVGGILGVGSIVAIIVSICSLKSNRTGPLLLILSCVFLIAVTLCVTLLHRRIIRGVKPKDRPVFESIPNDTTNNISIERDIANNDSLDYIFCHKCGKRMIEDSHFCSSCGTKLK